MFSPFMAFFGMENELPSIEMIDDVPNDFAFGAGQREAEELEAERESRRASFSRIVELYTRYQQAAHGKYPGETRAEAQERYRIKDGFYQFLLLATGLVKPEQMRGVPIDHPPEATGFFDPQRLCASVLSETVDRDQPEGRRTYFELTTSLGRRAPDDLLGEKATKQRIEDLKKGLIELKDQMIRAASEIKAATANEQTTISARNQLSVNTQSIIAQIEWESAVFDHLKRNGSTYESITRSQMSSAELAHMALQAARRIHQFITVIEHNFALIPRFYPGNRKTGEPDIHHPIIVHQLLYQFREYYATAGSPDGPRIDLLRAMVFRDVLAAALRHDGPEDNFPEIILLKTSEGNHDYKYRVIYNTELPDDQDIASTVEICSQSGWHLQRIPDGQLNPDEQGKANRSGPFFRLTATRTDAERLDILQTKLYRAQRSLSARHSLILVPDPGVPSQGNDQYYRLRVSTQQNQDEYPNEWFVLSAVTNTHWERLQVLGEVLERYPYLAGLPVDHPVILALAKATSQTNKIRVMGNSIRDEVKHGRHTYQGSTQLPFDILFLDGDLERPYAVSLEGLTNGLKLCDKAANLATFLGAALPKGGQGDPDYDKLKTWFTVSIIEAAILQDNFHYEQRKAQMQLLGRTLEQTQSIELEPPVDTVKLGLLLMYHQDVRWFSSAMNAQIRGRLSTECETTGTQRAFEMTTPDIHHVIEEAWAAMQRELASR